MLFKTIDKASGKVLKHSRPLMITPQQAYVRPSQGKDWFTIPDFSNYEISKSGEVRRSIHTNPRSRGWSRKKPGDVLSPAKKGKKYPNLTLVRDDGKYCDLHIHTLVAITFHGPRPKGMFALHKDDDGHNNHYTNIYWGTQAQNNADMHRNGHGLLGEKHPNCTVTNADVLEIRRLSYLGRTQQSIADQFGISQSTVSIFIRNIRRKLV